MQRIFNSFDKALKLLAAILVNNNFFSQMDKVYKKAFSFFSGMVLFALHLSAQQNHFIYVQTENKQPFYIKLDKKILSSSASGYLIIPKLQDDSYALTIGFPKNEWPEQNVTCSINKKDAGYLLKNFGDKGWGLFNLQTMEMILPGTKPVDNKNVAEDKQDLFSNTLSNVVNDPSIIKRTEDKAMVKEEVKPVTETVKTEEPQKPVEAIKKEEAAPPVVQINRLLSIKSAEGIEMVYTDMVNGQADTIRLFIPEEKKEASIQPEKKTEIPVVEVPKKEEVKIDEHVKEPEKKDSTKNEVIVKADIKNEEPKKEEPKKEEVKMDEPVKAATKNTEPKKEAKNNDPKFIDITIANPNAKKDTVAKPSPAAVPVEEKKAPVVQATEKPKENSSRPLIFNSDCKNFAKEEDFIKLRKKMVAEDKDDDMVDIAKKAFRSKCFTTEQVKNLSVLFLKDEGKYKFFDAAYPFVSDSYNFGTLETQLSDNYFITRFKAMIHH